MSGPLGREQRERIKQLKETQAAPPPPKEAKPAALRLPKDEEELVKVVMATRTYGELAALSMMVFKFELRALRIWNTRTKGRREKILHNVKYTEKRSVIESVVRKVRAARTFDPSAEITDEFWSRVENP